MFAQWIINNVLFCHILIFALLLTMYLALTATSTSNGEVGVILVKNTFTNCTNQNLTFLLTTQEQTQT